MDPTADPDPGPPPGVAPDVPLSAGLPRRTWLGAARGARFSPACLLVLFLVGLLLWRLPSIVRHQIPLFFSDHGWDLYAMQEVARGRVPMRDFQWPYGPLGLLYYAGAFRVLGEDVWTVRAAYMALVLAGAGIAAATLWRRVGPIGALAAAVVLFQLPQLPALYSQGALIPPIALAILAAIRTAERRQAGDHRGAGRALAGLVMATALALLVKPTVGIAAAGSLGAALAVAHLMSARAAGAPAASALAPRALALPAAAVLAPILAGTLLLLPWAAGLPAHRLTQNFPWSPGMYPNRRFFMDALSGWPDMLVAVLRGETTPLVLTNRFHVVPWLWVAALLAVVGWTVRAWRRRETADALPVVACALIGTGFEFLLLGTVYSLMTGAVPAIALGLALGATGGRRPNPARRTGPLGAAPGASPPPACAHETAGARGGWIAAGAVAAAALGWCLVDVAGLEAGAAPLDLPRAHVRVSPPQLVRVEADVTRFVEHNLPPDAELLVLPYGPLFNFLTGRRAPFYSVQHVLPYRAPGEDEEYTRALLEKQLPCILIVNVSLPGAAFGADFGVKLGLAVNTGYRQVGQIGEGEWQWQSANEALRPQVLVLWRRDLPPPAWWPK